MRYAYGRNKPIRSTSADDTAFWKKIVDLVGSDFLNGIDTDISVTERKIQHQALFKRIVFKSPPGNRTELLIHYMSTCAMGMGNYNELFNKVIPEESLDDQLRILTAALDHPQWNDEYVFELYERAERFDPTLRKLIFDLGPDATGKDILVTLESISTNTLKSER